MPHSNLKIVHDRDLKTVYGLSPLATAANSFRFCWDGIHQPLLPDEPTEPQLTEDEERMLAAYRRFRWRSKPGAAFRWKSPGKEHLVTPPEPSLLIDPNEADDRWLLISKFSTGISVAGPTSSGCIRKCFLDW